MRACSRNRKYTFRDTYIKRGHNSKGASDKIRWFDYIGPDRGRFAVKTIKWLCSGCLTALSEISKSDRWKGGTSELRSWTISDGDIDLKNAILKISQKEIHIFEPPKLHKIILGTGYQTVEKFICILVLRFFVFIFVPLKFNANFLSTTKTWKL
jgi:hypothetical protein